MGLFNKLKSVLFEEEEVEVPIEEPPKKVSSPVVEEKKVERKKNVFESNLDEDLTGDRDLFKAEKTFDFPMFDDQEFEEMKHTFEPEPEPKPVEEPPKKTMGFNLFDSEKPKLKKNKTEEIKGRAYESKSTGIETRKFRPSPVISPVYGVLDKNYKKEDIIVKKEEKKTFDVDDVRKKAFGTLEDDIERTLMQTRQIEVVHEKEEKIVKEKPKEKSIDELLEGSSFDTIDVPDEKEVEVEPKETELFDTIDNEDVVIQNDPELEEKLSMDVLDEYHDKTEEEKIEDDETLENDLYHLIDSMYENKEEE